VYHAAGSARTGAFLPESTEGFGCVLVLKKLNMFVVLKDFVRFMADDNMNDSPTFLLTWQAYGAILCSACLATNTASSMPTYRIEQFLLAR
jgi:hypothetical protein